MARLHVVVPVFNEERTLDPCLRRVFAVTLPAGWQTAVHLVDDHSEARAYASARAVVEALRDEGHAIGMSRHEVNLGKGAALRTGFDAVLAEGDDDDAVVIQDADLEYDPEDLPLLLEPVLRQRVRCVIGTRWGPHNPLQRGWKRQVHAMGNAGLTFLSNTMTGYRLRDMECCYKLMTLPLLRDVRGRLTEDRFGVEPQLVATLSRMRESIEQVPVRYEPRGLVDGKKIGWTDGVRALLVIGRERIWPTQRGGAS